MSRRGWGSVRPKPRAGTLDDPWGRLKRADYYTRLARSGLHAVETSEILGHASPAFTMSVYQHSTAESFERTRRAVEGAFER